MGTCCQVKQKPISQQAFTKKLTRLIEDDSSQSLAHCIRQKTDLDTIVILQQSAKLSPLGYALLLGSRRSFQVLFESSQCDIKLLSSQFKDIGKRPMHIICEQGNLELLKYYLPIYLEDPSIEEFPIDPQKYRNHLTPLTSIQRACERGHTNIVKFLVKYFENKQPLPEFNLHHIEESTGNNCALVACRTGNVQLLRYLFRELNVDFHVLNKCRESAIQISAAWSKKKQCSFIDSFKFLVEEVNVNFLYEYEETLLVLEDKKMIEYLETKLFQEGIKVSKNDIDHRYSLTRNRNPVPVDTRLNSGPQFEFKEIFNDEPEEFRLEMSSISEVPSKNVSNFQDLSQILKAELD